MGEVLVIGHRNPDTDAICSAIGYAEFKRRTGMDEAVAARCGDTNERIDFVLKTFGVPPPRFVADVTPRVRDVMQTSVVSVLPDMPVAETLTILDEHDLRVIPVLDQKRRCRGLLSMFKIMKFHLPAPNRLFESRRVVASLDGITRTLHGKLLHAIKPDEEEELLLTVAAMTPGSFRRRVEAYAGRNLIVVVGDREDIQELAVREKVRCIVITGDLPVSERIMNAAREDGVSIISSSHDSITTATLCRASIQVRHMVDENYLSFRDEMTLTGARRLAIESEFHAFPVVNENDEVVGILSKSDFLKRVDRRLILVDHNELTQAVHGADQVEIIEIIDHHRIGSLSTQQPILFRNEPVGSTSTIVADCFLRHRVELPKPIAGLLLAGITSDTLNLSSPTATQRDAEVLRELERISGTDATEFTNQLFSSGSILINRPTDEAITADCKEYEERGHRFSVAQIEEIGFNHFWQRMAEVMTSLELHRKANGYLFSALLVTDVVRRTSLLLLAAGKPVLDLIDYPEIEPGVYQLDDVVSRKKQLLPYLTHCLERLG
jgi:manganese-dependent inorganic pyrophosphatase